MRGPIRVHASSNRSEPPQVGQARRAAASAARAKCGVRTGHAKVALTVVSVASQGPRSNGANGNLRLSSAQGATGFSLRRLLQQNLPKADSCSETKTALTRSTDRSFFRPDRGELCSVALRPLVGDRAALYHVVDGFRDVGGVIT